MATAITNDMKVLNDSITKMPTMITVNQNQPISGNHSSKASATGMNKTSSRQGALGQAGAVMMNVPDSSRNNQAVTMTGGGQKGNLVMVNPNTVSRTASNQKDIENFISGGPQPGIDINDITQQSLHRHTGSGVPRKQGRMFQLSLNQNTGPFNQKEIRGCPQIDKFATYGINAICNGKLSPRIGILGESTFPSDNEFGSQFQTNAQSDGMGTQNFNSGGLGASGSQMLSMGMKIDDVSMSVNQQIKSLEDSLVLGYDNLQLFKEEADQIRKEIDVMMNVLIEKTEVVQDELHVETRQDYKLLKSNIKQQRDENEVLYKSMKKVLKDNEFQREKISVFNAKIEELEQHVGMLSNAPNDELYPEPQITSNVGEHSKQEMDSIVEEQQPIRVKAKISNDNLALAPLPDHQDEVQGASSMERLMSKEAEGLIESGTRNKQQSIATLNNDLQPHSNGYEQTQINQDIYTPNGGSIHQLQ